MERTEMLADLIVELARRVSSAEDAAMSNKAMYDMEQAEIRRLEDELKAAVDMDCWAVKIWNGFC